MYVCLCRGITDGQIKQAIATGQASSMRCLNSMGVATQCGKCGRAAKDLLKKSFDGVQTSYRAA